MLQQPDTIYGQATFLSPISQARRNLRQRKFGAPETMDWISKFAIL
jgi:hypothetical protein